MIKLLAVSWTPFVQYIFSGANSNPKFWKKKNGLAYFVILGGAAGGGYSQVIPMEEVSITVLKIITCGKNGLLNVLF